MTEPGSLQHPRTGRSPGVGLLRKHRKPALLGAISLVVVLVAGLATWLAWPSPPKDRTPFDQALARLATAEGVQYTDRAIYGAKRDITTTRFGEQFGVTGSPGLEQLDQGVLRVGGKLYTKFQRDNSGRLSKWKTGDPGDEYMYGDLIKEFPPPQELAATLTTALADVRDLPSPADPGLPALSVAGVPALRAETSAGSLYVARDAPHRVLRLEPQGMLSPSRLPELTGQPTLPDLPSARPGMESLGKESQGMDLSVLEDDQADQMYDTLAEDTKGLANAVDSGITFALTAAGTFTCSAAGCLVTESYQANVSAKAKGRVTGGQVTAKLTVTNVTIDGRPAGGCVSPPTTIPIIGDSTTGQLSCNDLEAGPVFAAVEAEYAQRAQAQANASGGRVTLRWSDFADAEIDALALAQVEVDQLLTQQQQERDACPAPNSFTSGTRVLLADGSTRPIEKIVAGDQVRTADPATGHTSTESVAALITGTGQKTLDELTISDGRRTGTLTATGNHPFWDPARRSWVDAANLFPGEPLTGPSPSDSIHVTANRAYRAKQTVHNLSVAGTHTFYVLAGDTPALVHNTEPCPIGTKISAQKQGRHLQGHPLYADGGYFKNITEAQKVLDAYHANKVTILGAIPEKGQIIVHCPTVIGYNNNPANNHLDQPTNVFMIKGTRSVSIVPIDPNWKP
ncbi:polymorphic toxin-type HINT domain-containing protein [Amycolatopsis solani]|uniref:polymorphic toxin-type HINT domain-containing protein n=1 Tax=Amycolatopsis solani TaxID=3028615 RepID=UPI0025B21B41|nr:polymorphic toxin-type HINT domain-containing protein [Amycolatopsis sp. MEP2-6]